MYQVRYWLYNQLKSRVFETLHDAVIFTVYTAPFQSVHSIDLIKEKNA
jgi:hypothetical protein